MIFGDRNRFLVVVILPARDTERDFRLEGKVRGAYNCVLALCALDHVPELGHID